MKERVKIRKSFGELNPVQRVEPSRKAYRREKLELCPFCYSDECEGDCKEEVKNDIK